MHTTVNYTFRLESNPYFTFSAGVLKSKAKVDRESLNDSVIKLLFSNNGDERITKYVFVKDINDNPPIFGQSAVEVDVSENLPSKKEVKQIFIFKIYKKFFSKRGFCLIYLYFPKN